MDLLPRQRTASIVPFPGARDVDVWSAGLEYDGKIDIFEMGATGIMQFGDVKFVDGSEVSAKGYLFDIFGGVNLGPANIHLKGIYASGEDSTDTDDNYDAFFTLGPVT